MDTATFLCKFGRFCPSGIKWQMHSDTENLQRRNVLNDLSVYGIVKLVSETLLLRHTPVAQMSVV